MKRSLLEPPHGWMWWAKGAATALVGAATAVLAASVDATPLQVVCAAIVGTGAALGIVSGGMGRH